MLAVAMYFIDNHHLWNEYSFNSSSVLL